MGKGCIFVTMCAPKQLMGSLVEMTKTKVPYLNGIEVILLQIGHQIILNKREKAVYNELLIHTISTQLYILVLHMYICLHYISL